MGKSTQVVAIYPSASCHWLAEVNAEMNGKATNVHNVLCCSDVEC